MPEETLEDHLRKATRHFTSPLPENDTLTLGRDLLREMARAHAETPPRFPLLEPSAIPMLDGRPRLEGGGAPDAGFTLFEVGALLHSLLATTPPEISWWLDGPPPAQLTSLARTAALRGLVSASPDARFPTAQVAADALDAALVSAPASSSAWTMFRGGPERTGSRPGPPSATRLTPLWQAPLGAIVSSPVLTSRWVVAATADGRLVWLDRGTGRRLSERKVASALESSPAVEADRLYLGTDDGELLALDAESGRDVWRAKLGTARTLLAARGRRARARGGGGGKGHGRPRRARCRQGQARSGSASSARSSRRRPGPERASSWAATTGRCTRSSSRRGARSGRSPLGARVRATPAVASDSAVVGDFEGRVAAVKLEDGARALDARAGRTPSTPRPA